MDQNPGMHTCPKCGCTLPSAPYCKRCGRASDGSSDTKQPVNGVNILAGLIIGSILLFAFSQTIISYNDQTKQTNNTKAVTNYKPQKIETQPQESPTLEPITSNNRAMMTIPKAAQSPIMGEVATYQGNLCIPVKTKLMSCRGYRLPGMRCYRNGLMMGTMQPVYHYWFDYVSSDGVYDYVKYPSGDIERKDPVLIDSSFTDYVGNN